MNDAYEYLIRNTQIKYGDSVVVAVSGGPDSMALLHLMSRMKKAIDIEVVCAHVNHNLRKESSYEKEFVERFCRTHGIVFEYMKIDEYGDDNFHNEARTKRYHYFGKIVQKYHAKYLLTAHHGDDLIETILMRIVRGSTLRGYSGFSKVVNMGDYQIVRPLINVTKDQILIYNKKNKIEFVQDKSNEKDVYTRNRFRKYIVPGLKKEDIEVHKKFYKYSRTLLEYNEYIEKIVQKKIKKICPQNVLNIEEYLKEENVIQMKIIYYMLENFYQDDLMLITDKHAELVHHLICSKKANLSIHLPNNVKAIKAYKTFTLSVENIDAKEYEVEMIRYVNLPNGHNIQLVSKSNKEDNDVCRLSSEEVKFPLHVRSRKTGDKMAVKGMLGRQKVGDIFTNEKVDVKEREIWPVVVDSEENIVWLPGLKKSKFDKQKGEKYDIILKYY